jgi:hypothetical protein
MQKVENICLSAVWYFIVSLVGVLIMIFKRYLEEEVQNTLAKRINEYKNNIQK